ncbi:hypothetical protein [Azospirillum soli]|uniref:hypothetical protein n=1 Tax=Azospirillum soli TaxID=1304799 RepID=UPI001AE1EDBB|nr:hypothetical protein [Azospirillum soli]MBP2311253.1 hypothetical protein [Azospirillum soli]
MRKPQGWAGFVKTLLLTAGGLVAALFLFVLLVDPYDNVPFSPPIERPMMDDNQRFLYPGLVRSGQFDSAVFGTSTSRLLQPAHLNGQFGGRFANLAMNSATAWEQYRIADLFLRTVPAPRTVVFGLDRVWCEPDADTQRLTFRPFPPWMYDDDRWNDLAYLLNGKTLEIAGRLVEYHLGLRPPRLGPDGYERFVPPDSEWDWGKVEPMIWGGPKKAIVPVDPPYVPGEAERQGWRYPALAWLEELVDRLPAETQPILAFMPVHVAALPQPGSVLAAREQECKDRIARIGAAHGAAVVDFRFASRITTEDTNYWDSLHYRVGIADWIEQSLGMAMRERRDDPEGAWRLLVAPVRRTPLS